MSSNLRIVFMGTPDFASYILESMIKSGENIVGVISVPDKPAGRGQKMHSSAVSQLAKKYDLNLLQPSKLNSKSFIEKLTALDADVFVVIAFRMLPKSVWKIPPKGTFNLHASLLPDYRGAAPINHAIMNGETETGVTTFLIDEKIDTGNILLQEKITINPDENAGSLHDKLMKMGAEVVIKTLDGLAQDRISAQPQIEKKDIQYAHKIFKEDCAIDWDNSLEEIYNFIRGLSPYPVAWTTLSHDGIEKSLKIYSANIQYKNHPFPIRKVIKDGQKLGVAHKDGIIWLEQLQLEGKRKMKVLDFINGFDLKEDTIVLNP